MTYTVYALSENGVDFRYVGATNAVNVTRYVLAKRYRCHHRTSPSYRWLAEIFDTQRVPIITILESDCTDIHRERERWWIRKLRDDGYDLLNVQDGGTRGFTHHQHTAEVRAKIASALTGKKRGPHSLEHRRKIGDAHRGRTVSIESRKRMSDAHIGKTPWNKGKKLTEQQHTGHQWSDEQRQKIQQAWNNASRESTPCSECSKICRGQRGLAVHIGMMHSRR